MSTPNNIIPMNGEQDTLPHSIESEQAIIGSLLYNNEIHDHLGHLIKPEHFYDPVHALLFDTICRRIQSNKMATPITISALLNDNEGFKELDGMNYLTNLALSVSSIMAVKDYVALVYDFAMRRGLIQIAQATAAGARDMGQGEAGTHITKAEESLYLLSSQGHIEKGFQGFAVSMVSAITQMTAAYQRDGSLAGLATGLSEVDRILGGLQKSDLVILAGRPSMGKTALATNIAFHIAKNYEKGITADGTEGTIRGGVVGFFSLEMSASQLANRILAEQTEVDSYKMRSGRMKEDEFKRIIEAAKTLETCPLFIDDAPALKINELATRARRLKRTHGLDLLVVDYLQLVHPTRETGRRVDDVSAITQGLKAIAKELDIPVLALSQLSRKVEDRDDKKPQLADLRESGSIEQDSDVVMFVYRGEYYLGRKEPSADNVEKMNDWQAEMTKVRNKAEIIVGKHRNGAIGTIELHFNPKFTKFGNLAKATHADPNARGDRDDATDF